MTRWNAPRTAAALDISVSYLHRMARQGIIPRPVAGAWDIVQVSRAYIRTLDRRDNANSRDDRARRLHAEANMAEQKAAKMASELCLASDYYGHWRAGIAQGVAGIRRLRTLTAEQKASVIAELEGIELAPLK